MTMLYRCKRCGWPAYAENLVCQLCGYSRWVSRESALRDNLVYLGWCVWLLDRLVDAVQWLQRRNMSQVALGKAVRAQSEKPRPLPGPTLADWDAAGATGCPYQRYSEKLGSWLVLGTVPPCERKVCSRDQCHNFGHEFKDAHGYTRVVPRASGNGHGQT